MLGFTIGVFQLFLILGGAILISVIAANLSETDEERVSRKAFESICKAAERKEKALEANLEAITPWTDHRGQVDEYLIHLSDLKYPLRS